jgi:hypothetical protein
MATTTNYGWTTPDDTALVKDGASAIRTLGSSVDTTTKALNPSTTLGDIEYRSSTANTNTRLGIGTSGQYLTVSGGVPAWGDISAGGMTLLSTTTLASTTTSISGISGIYNNLFILIQGITMNSSTTVSINPNGSSSISTYAFQYGSTNDSGISESIKLTANQNVDNTGGLNAYAMTINNYASSSYYKAFNWSGTWPTSSARRSVYGGGGIETTSAITSINVVCGGGNTFSGGQVLIYGVK